MTRLGLLFRSTPKAKFKTWTNPPALTSEPAQVSHLVSWFDRLSTRYLARRSVLIRQNLCPPLPGRLRFDTQRLQPARAEMAHVVQLDIHSASAS